MNKTALVPATLATHGLSTAAFAATAPATKERVKPAHSQALVAHKKGVLGIGWQATGSGSLVRPALGPPSSGRVAFKSWWLRVNGATSLSCVNGGIADGLIGSRAKVSKRPGVAR
jgi:hypothetical protein